MLESQLLLSSLVEVEPDDAGHSQEDHSTDRQTQDQAKVAIVILIGLVKSFLFLSSNYFKLGWRGTNGTRRYTLRVVHHKSKRCNEALANGSTEPDKLLILVEVGEDRCSLIATDVGDSLGRLESKTVDAESICENDASEDQR